LVIKKVTTDSNDSQDLPWLNEWLACNGEKDIDILVHDIVITQKGLMVITEEFKAFLFKDSAIYSFIKEALIAWVDNAAIAFPLYACVENSKLTLGMDSDDKPVNWIFHNKVYTQKKGKQGGDGLQSPVNPFLIGTSSPTVTKRTRKTTEPTDPYPNQMSH